LADIIIGPATATGNARSDPRTAHAPEKKARAGSQPEAAPSHLPAIQNLKMSSPVAPQHGPANSGANSGDGLAPIADVAATTDAPATTPAGLLTSAGLLTTAGRTSKPPAAPPGEPAPAAPAARVITNPKLLSSPHVVYPPSAKQLNVQGSVSLVLTIDADGNVSAAKALSGPLLLRQGAVESVKQWKYSPATQDGKSVPSQVTVSVDFHLN
jgi:protein TonB